MGQNKLLDKNPEFYELVLYIGLLIFILFPGNGLAQVAEEWVAIYNGQDDSSDGATALAVDAAGNVYVTGSSSHFNPDFDIFESDYATVKYDPNGHQLWVARYNGPGPYSFDGATAIAVDSVGNVYVTGTSVGDYATIKYDANGNQLWVARYSDSTQSSDYAFAIAVDQFGNVYVSGYNTNYSTGFTSVTIKYDTDGNQLWVSRHDGISISMMVIDAIGNVYVTGDATIKYDSNGNELWLAYPDSHGYANDIVLDNTGNIYITGRSAGDYVTIKYDTNGNQLWSSHYNGPGNYDDFARALAVDIAGNVYVTGEITTVGGSRDFATIKYDPNGNEIWVAQYNGPGNSLDGATALTLDAEGNVYVTGSSIAEYTYADYTTIKYDPNGNEIWVARYTSPQNGGDFANALVVDNTGNVYVTGVTGAISGREDYTTIKYSQSTPRLINLSARGLVGTGDNVMIGGFYIGGTAPKTVLIRGRGPSMGGDPFNIPGPLPNPSLTLPLSTGTAQNDNWQDAPQCPAGYQCGGPAEIMATGFDPCQPNPGQTVSPPDCALESAILITLPPGGYTVILSGVGGTTGIGLVEVFDVDPASPSRLINLSARGMVQTGDNVLIGGFWIEGTTHEDVAVRARGPSMSSAPFNVPGVLADPSLELHSGPSFTASNDNWQGLIAFCIGCPLPVPLPSALEPCQPNPGQTTAPTGCTQEAGFQISLPAGGHTAIVRGVGDTTGIGLMEVFESNQTFVVP